jgi:hypothetical protein
MIRRLTQKVQGEIRRPKTICSKTEKPYHKGKEFVVVDQDLAEVTKIVILPVTEIDN